MRRQLTSRNTDDRGTQVQETDERFVCRAFAETGMCHDRRRRVAAACMCCRCLGRRQEPRCTDEAKEFRQDRKGELSPCLLYAIEVPVEEKPCTRVCVWQ